jgi:Protein of unknown function DUF917, C-terminal
MYSPWRLPHILTHTHVVAPLLPDEAEQTSDVPQTLDPQSRLLITFQNENLTAELMADHSSSKQMLAVVPDLITVLDAQSGSSLGTHEYRYGVSMFSDLMVSSTNRYA